MKFSIKKPMYKIHTQLLENQLRSMLQNICKIYIYI